MNTDKYYNLRSYACDIQSLLRERESLRAALYRISLASQNSMSSKEECGHIARAALDENK